jgi:hypothetical protein
MAKNRLVKNKKTGQYGVYNPFNDTVTPITSDMSLVKNTRGQYGFKKGNEIFSIDEMPESVNLEETFKKKVDTVSSSATSSTDSTSDFYKPVGVEAVDTKEPKKQIEAKQAAKQEESQRYIDIFGLTRLDYSGLQNYGSLGELAADALDVPANLSKAFVRGVSNGRINQAIMDYAKDGETMDSDLIARLIKENKTKTGSTYLKTLQEKGVLQTDDLSAVGGIAETIMESMGSMLGTVKAGFQGAIVGGSTGLATGAAATSIGGPVGAALGAVGGATGGAVSGFAGFTSYANEYGSTIVQALTEKGYDLTDKNSVEKGLKDKSVMDSAKEKANTRGLTVGAFDAITAGLAGKGAKLAVNIARGSAAKVGKELTKAGVKRIAGATALGIESTMGSVGEAMGQLATEGKITDYDAVALEGIAEIGNAGPSTAFAMYKSGQINSDLNQENQAKIESLKKAKEAIPADNEASLNAIDNKISALEKENKNRNKAMTSALQVAPVPATKRVIELTDSILELEATLEAIKDGSRTDVSQEAKKAMWDSLNDMIAERDEIRQEMLKASETEAKLAAAPEKPMIPVVNIKPVGQQAKEGEVLPSPVPQNNATQLAKDTPLEVKKVEEPVMFSTKFDDEKSLKQGTAYKVSQGENNFGTIIEHDNNGEKEFVLAETGKKYSSLDDAKFALQEKLTGERVSEMDRVGIDRIKVEGNLANKPIFIGDPANNNQLDMESKGAIQKAVRALRSVSNANVYLYGNAADYAKGIAHATGQTASDVANQAGKSNAQVVDANGENSIHINLEKADVTSLSHEVFHGALLGLAKKDPNAFITMRDKILDRISEKQSLMVTNPDGTKAKVSAKEYLLDFQKRYSGPEYTEADRAEEFLSELAGLMSLEDNNVVKDKTLLESIKLTIKDVLKKFNVEFDSLNELQETEDLVQFFKDFNRSVKTGESINLSRVQGIQGVAPTAAQPATQPTAQVQPSIPATKFKETKSGGQESELVPLLTIKREENFKLSDEVIYGKTKIDKKGNATTEFYTKFSEDKIPVSGKTIYYDNENNKFNQYRKGKTGQNGEGGKSLSDFENDYGIPFDEVLKGLGIKLKDNEEVLNFRVDKESIEMHPVSGKLKKVHGKVAIIPKGTNGMKSKDTYISYYTPKLKYTDAITGISTAQPEAGAVKESATTRPEGAKKKEPIAKVISRAADKAQESVKKTKGNRKPISERVPKVEGIIGQALRIEPASAYDLALQYFIGGGRVLRGKVTNGSKPDPHTLITLFTRPRQGYYVASEKEMASRGFLTKKDGLLITEIAHKLWESQANEYLGLEESEMRSAVEAVLLDHTTTSSMAKDIISRHGNPEQRALISGANDMPGLSEYEMFVAGQIANEFGVSVEEVIENPEKFVNKDELEGMQEDMLTAFQILDELQDDEAIKEYLGISAPEDLFLDELVAEAAKPEKTLQEKKADLEKQIKAKKKELAAANKTKKEMGGIGQTSLVEGVQTTIVAPDTMKLYEKIRNLKGEIEDLNSQLGKIESAIEFKERKTIDAFADVVEQKVEENAPEVAPSNEEDKPQWLIEQDAEYALRDKEDLELMRLSDEVYYAKQQIAGDRDTDVAIKNYNEVKAKRDAYESAVNKRRQDREDAIDIQSLIDDEINNSENPKYEYAEDFKKSPLLAAYKHAQDLLEYISSSDYVEYQVKTGYQTREQAIKDQENGIANWGKRVFLLETAIVKESMAEQAAKTEPAKAELSKKEKEIKSLEEEIRQYELEIEDATEEIENTNYNYREAVDEIKAEKKELAASSLDRETKAEQREELDARLEDVADERDTYIEQYKDTIAEAKKEIKALQKKIDKLSVRQKFQLSGDKVEVLNKSGIANIFTSNPSLSKIGTQEQYKKYISSIFPESLIDNIVWRAQNDKGLRRHAGVYFSAYKSYADNYGKAYNVPTKPFMLDMKNPKDLFIHHKESKRFAENIVDDVKIRFDEIPPNDIALLKSKGYDGAFVNLEEFKGFHEEEKPGIEIVAFDAEQIHALGDEKDAKMFADYVFSNPTIKSQLEGPQISPFQKADPTYKYQLSGTEASLKLIDEVRKKYNMQHTAEEMGIVKKGMRATEGIISNNIVTRVLSKGSVAVNKMFSNDKAYKLLGKPFAGLQNYIANNVRKGLGSQNAAAANASAIAVSLIQNLGSTEGFQSARNKLSGGKSVAKNQLWQLGKELNEMINNDKVALRRVHSLLDPEAFEDITDPTLPDSKADLSFAELRLFNVLRDMNDFIHEWHYRNGFLGTGEQADALYEKNKGSYFARMYNEIETERFGELYDALAKLPNAADFSMFKERKNFLDVTENLTLKEDPIYITTKRFGQMMQNQAILEFCDYVAKSKDYKIYKNKEDIPASAVSNYRLLAPKKGGGKVYGPLTGKYVPDIVAQQLQGIEFSNQAINLTYQAAKIFDKTFARQVLSKAKTVWNPLTRAGNITMNFVFASLAGVDPITLLKNRPAAKESLESYDSYARDLDANGLLGVSMGKELNEEKDKNAKIVLRDAANRLLKREGKATSEVELPASEKSKFRKIASDLDDMLTESYGKSDDVAKVALYKSLVDDYGKTREEAIKIVAGSMQNYNTVGKAYDYASKTVNRFVKFKADSARILYNSFKDRPLNLMATLGMYLAAQALASKISGEDEEERKIREERPYTNKIKIGPVTISLTMKFGDTEVNVARYLAPYSVYDAGYDSNWLKDASTYLPVQYDEHTFIAVNDPLIGPIVNLAADKDFRGMPISDPGKTPFIEKTVTDGEAFWNRVAFAGRNFGAPYYGWGENLIAAATGDKDYYGRSRSMSEAILNTVIKVQTVNNETLQRSYEGALRKLDRDIDNIGKTISHKANEKAENISEEASKEGMTDARLEKYIANQERIFMKFYEEQQKEGDKKIMELQRVQGVLGKLQEIKDRKK